MFVVRLRSVLAERGKQAREFVITFVLCRFPKGLK
jgi:hypothetical protein